MKLTNLFGKCIKILLIYFVTPSYQLINEKADNNILTQKLNQTPIKNVGRIVTPVTAQKISSKKTPIYITPQPLLIKRKVKLNHTEPAKQHGPINTKTHKGSNVDEPKPKHDPVESKVVNITSDLKTANHEEKSLFSKENEDFSYKKDENNVDKPKLYTPVYKRENHEDTSETHIKEDNEQEEPEHKEVSGNKEESKEIEIQRQDDSNKDDDNAQFSSSKDKHKNEADEPIDTHEEYNIHSNKPGNCSSNAVNNSQEKKTVLKFSNKPLKTYSREEPNKESILTRRNDNSEKKILNQVKTPHLTEVQINVSPKAMKKVTNDVDDKVFIKMLDFEELEENYNPDSCTDDNNEGNDSPFAPDSTFIKETYNYPSDDQIDIDTTYDNPITSRRLPSPANKLLRERIWRSWKNTEFHVKYNNKSKQKHAKKHTPNANDYSNFKSYPVNHFAYNTRANPVNRRNDVDNVLSVHRNVKFEPVSYGTEIQGEYSEKRYVDENSSVTNAPVDDTFDARANPSNRLTNFDTGPRLSNYGYGYDTYNSEYCDNRPRNFDYIKRDFNDCTEVNPFESEPYKTIAPAKSGIKYYSSNEYLSSRIQNCYFPQSYGNQYAPVSRYKKYLFPCM